MIETKTKLKIRKAPKFAPFMLVGAAAGLILAVFLNGSTPSSEGVLGFLVAWLAGLGAAVGIVVALVAEWLFNRSAKEVDATKLKQ